MEKKIFYGMVGLVLILLIVVVYGLSGNKQGNLKGSVDNLQQTGVTAYEDVAAGDYSTRGVALSIDSGTSTKILINRSPFTRWISNLSMLTLTGNSTDTPFRIYVGTTTSIGNNETAAGNGLDVPLYVAPPFAGLVSGYRIATSTVASSTPLSNLPRTGAGYQGAFPWKAGEGIFMVLQVDNPDAGRNLICASQTGPSMCSAATSTDRGFNVELLLQTYSTSTVR